MHKGGLSWLGTCGSCVAYMDGMWVHALVMGAAWVLVMDGFGNFCLLNQNLGLVFLGFGQCF